MILVGFSHAAGTVAGQTARLVARELGLGPVGQAVTVAVTHTVVGLACIPLDATGAMSPVSAFANGIASFEMTLMNETRKQRRAEAA
jgi:hypothetical protein